MHLGPAVGLGSKPHPNRVPHKTLFGLGGSILVRRGCIVSYVSLSFFLAQTKDELA